MPAVNAPSLNGRRLALPHIGHGESNRGEKDLDFSIKTTWPIAMPRPATAHGWNALAATRQAGSRHLRSPGVGKVQAAIHASPEQDWSVPELANIMGASRSSFAQAFKESVGESPARYVARVRMFQARSWIAQDGMRVTTAADRLGFDSEASFSRAFKRVIGHPPSKARSAM
jgi:transcriptional regulator GlxA family with amidase domain